MTEEFQRTVAEMMADSRDKIIIDLRKEEEYQKDSLPGARNIYWEEFEEKADSIPKNKPAYLLCYTGETSDEIADELQKKGYEAYSLQGGYRAYLRWKLSAL